MNHNSKSKNEDRVGADRIPAIDAKSAGIRDETLAVRRTGQLLWVILPWSVVHVDMLQRGSGDLFILFIFLTSYL